MTERIYYDDAFPREFEAQMISREAAGKLWRAEQCGGPSWQAMGRLLH